VPFELGRPLGIPDDPIFQKRVLLAVLKLLETPEGSFIEDFPEDVPESANEVVALACPVHFAQDKDELDEADQLFEAFKRGIVTLRPWYDISVERRGRTTVGSSGLGIDAIGDFIYSFLGEDAPRVHGMMRRQLVSLNSLPTI
jgi:hypothetical protein